jgi:CubicO group peptidase (beta-lactamase class C family)
LKELNDTIQSLFYFYNDPYLRQVEIPAANGITNAQSLAKLYASLIMNLDDGNQKPFLDETILKQAIQSNTPEGELDFIANVTSSAGTGFGMGFMLLDQSFPFFQSQVFGHPGKNLQNAFPFIHTCFYHLGAGGSVGLAIPSKNLSFAFVMNQLDISEIAFASPRIRPILEKVAKKLSDNY